MKRTTSLERTNLEHKTIVISVIGSLFMALLGVGFGIYTNSEAILLDGLFSFTGFVIAGITLKVSQLINQPETKNYQFGLSALEPMLNLIKGLVILVLCIFAAVDAAQVILSGGRFLDGMVVFIYASIASVGCFVVYAIIRKNAISLKSPILEADATNWLIDGIMSCAVGIAFVLAYLMRDGYAKAIIPYLDSGMVLVLVIAVLPVPINLVIKNMRQVLLGAPDESIQFEIQKIVEDQLADLKHKHLHYRMLQSGRHTFATVTVQVSKEKTVADLDQYRELTDRCLAKDHPYWTVELIFHGAS